MAKFHVETGSTILEMWYFVLTYETVYSSAHMVSLSYEKPLSTPGYVQMSFSQVFLLMPVLKSIFKLS